MARRSSTDAARRRVLEQLAEEFARSGMNRMAARVFAALVVTDEGERERLVANIVGHVGKTRVPEIRARAIQYWKSVDPGLGARVEAGLTPIDEPRTSLASEPVRTPAVF